MHNPEVTKVSTEKQPLYPCTYPQNTDMWGTLANSGDNLITLRQQEGYYLDSCTKMSYSQSNIGNLQHTQSFNICSFLSPLKKVFKYLKREI
jgi:hypothetical protein